MPVAGAAAGAGAQGSLDTLVAAEARRRRERPPGRDTEREGHIGQNIEKTHAHRVKETDTGRWRNRT